MKFYSIYNQYILSVKKQCTVTKVAIFFDKMILNQI